MHLLRKALPGMLIFAAFRPFSEMNLKHTIALKTVPGTLKMNMGRLTATQVCVSPAGRRVQAVRSVATTLMVMAMVVVVSNACCEPGVNDFSSSSRCTALLKRLTNRRCNGLGDDDVRIGSLIIYGDWW